MFYFDNLISTCTLGTHLQFYICQYFDGVYVMIELDSFRIPMSLDELPQLVPYFERLYNVVKTIYINCYTKENMSTRVAKATNDINDTLEPKILKAITEKTVDRSRYNCFYHPCLCYLVRIKKTIKFNET